MASGVNSWPHFGPILAGNMSTYSQHLGRLRPTTNINTSGATDQSRGIALGARACVLGLLDDPRERVRACAMDEES